MTYLKKYLKIYVICMYEFFIYFLPLFLQLFSAVLMEDPVLVQEVALLLLEMGADEEKKDSQRKNSSLSWIPSPQS